MSISPPTQPDQPQDETHDLFLSYNNRDRDDILRVRDRLREQRMSTFLDRDNLNPGQPWFDELQTAIGRVRAVAVFVGETLGPWQKREMTLALDRQAREEKLGRRFPVIPVVLSKADLDKAPGFLLLNTFVDLRGRLDDPAALEAIVRAVRGEAPPPATQPRVELCPYRALRAFREEDAPLFFGREAFAEQLLLKTQQQSLIAVVGPSGSGKSSVVQAGLMPLLRRQRPPGPTWEAVVFTPGTRPFHSLATTLVTIWGAELSVTQRLREAEELSENLAGGKTRLENVLSQAIAASEGADRLLVVMDQFEELFTLTEEKDRRPFVEALLAAASVAPVTIALTLRADFYGQAIGLHRDLSDRMQQGVVNLGPMTRDELRRAIENPAHSVGLEFESGLVKNILDNIEDQPGNLPLLEFALTELWNKRQGRLLTHRQYEEIGEVAGAIGQRAEQLFGSLKPDEQRAALRAFTRLVRVAAANEEGTDTRQRVRLSDLDETARAAAQQFVKARLLVTSRHEATNEETIEVAHEALIRKWPRLTDVLHKDREFLLWRQRLGFMSREWQRTNKDQGALLDGALLQEAKSWSKERSEELNEQEREFITASESASRRPRYWIAAAAALVIMAGLAFAGWQYSINTPGYQINQIIRQSPGYVKAAVAAEREFQFLNVTVWLATLALTGRSNEALDAARKIENANSRARALASIVGVLAKAGKAEESKQAATEARDAAREIENPETRAQALVSIVGVLAKAGKAEESKQAATEVLDAAHKLKNAFSRDRALVTIVKEYVEAGKTEKALYAAHMIKDADYRAQALANIAEVLAKAGKAEESKQAATEALDDAHMIKDADSRAQALASIVQALVRVGTAEEALDAARKIENAYTRDRALVSVVEALVKAGKPEEALDAARKIEDADSRSRALVSVVEVSARGLETAGKARNAIESAQQAAEQITDEGTRSAALANVATGLAKLHLYRQARELVDNNNTSAKDKLTAYTAILREYYLENHSGQAQLFEEERQKED